jgi:PhnB protein
MQAASKAKYALARRAQLTPEANFAAWRGRNHDPGVKLRPAGRYWFWRKFFNKNDTRLSLGDRFVRRKIERITKTESTYMNATVQPYLFFNGNCEEAVEFYKKTLGAEVQRIVRYKESPEPPPPGTVPPNYGEKIMHVSFLVGQTVVMASDSCQEGKSVFEGFSLALTVTNEADAEGAFNALTAGGQVKMPLTKTFWSPKFGMLTDKFGIEWMVSVMHK